VERLHRRIKEDLDLLYNSATTYFMYHLGAACLPIPHLCDDYPAYLLLLTIQEIYFCTSYQDINPGLTKNNAYLHISILKEKP
jgi:hypothetical protein